VFGGRCYIGAACGSCLAAVAVQTQSGPLLLACGCPNAAHA